MRERGGGGLVKQSEITVFFLLQSEEGCQVQSKSLGKGNKGNRMDQKGGRYREPLRKAPPSPIPSAFNHSMPSTRDRTVSQPPTPLSLHTHLLPLSTTTRREEAHLFVISFPSPPHTRERDLLPPCEGRDSFSFLFYSPFLPPFR